MKRNLEVRPTPGWHMPLIVIGSIFLMNASVFGAVILHGVLS